MQTSHKELLKGGWALWWRMVLPPACVLIPAFVAFITLTPDPGQPPAWLELLLVLGAVGLPAAWILLLGRAARRIARPHGINLGKFAGWSVFWRWWLLMIPVTIVYNIAIMVVNFIPLESRVGAIVYYPIFILLLLTQVVPMSFGMGLAFSWVIRKLQRRATAST